MKVILETTRSTTDNSRIAVINKRVKNLKTTFYPAKNITPFRNTLCKAFPLCIFFSLPKL